MTRKSGPVTVTILLGVCASFGVWLWQKPNVSETTAEALPPASPGELGPVPSQEMPAAPQAVAAPQVIASGPRDAGAASSNAPESAPPTIRELHRATFAFYDELAESIEALKPDCAAMAYTMSAVIEDKMPALTTMMATLDGGAKALVAGPDGAAVKARIAEFTALVRAQMPACAAQLEPVLSRWSALQTARSGDAAK